VSDAAQGTGDEPLAQPGAAGVRSVTYGQATIAGVRQPIVLILLLIAFFTTVSGKPLDGFLMLTVAALMLWDAARTLLRGGPTGPGAAGPRVSAATSGAAADARGSPQPGAGRRWLTGLGWLTAGLAYAGTVGEFRRYSWPATAAIVALGCLMVAIGWQGPLRRRQQLTGRALRRAWVWAVVLVCGGLWELSSLLQQPHLTTDSYAHPTISALTDPLLTSHAGRSVTLSAWLLLGWFLVGR
jgi:hypothetical protein